tara:strand:- start:3187 stop:3444 length:258 start_codon:yes stop_codon:yes gene_type:complete
VNNMAWEDIFKKVDTLKTRREAMAKRLRSLLEDLTSETEKAIEGREIGITIGLLGEVENGLKKALELVSSLNRHSAAMSEVKRGE